MPLTPMQPRTGAASHRVRQPLFLASAAIATLLALPMAGGAPGYAQTPPAEQPVARAAQSSLEKARAAFARGDLRTAQIEYRNAVRADPNSGMLRYQLAQISMDMGDTDTAEKEARAALDRNYAPDASTALLLRGYLGRGRYREVLREFPMPGASAPPGVAAQIGMARVLSSIATNDRDAAKAELEALRSVAPNAAETHLAAATVAAAEGNRAELAAAIDRALAVSPTHPEALLRKAGLQLEQNQRAEGIATLDTLIAAQPNLLQARLLRAEAYLRAGDAAKAQQDVDAALRVAPGSVPALYQRALLQARAQDFRGADETITRLGPALANFAEGLLFQASVKRSLGQTEQALDAVQRYVARHPEDPRGGKLLAVMELERNQPAAAVGALERLVQRNVADTETYDLLSRALVAAGRPRDAVQAMQRLAAAQPNDASVQTRLSATRLAAGDTAGTVQAAQEALRLSPNLAPARELLIVASLARGDIATAEAEMQKIPADARQSELMGVADATLKIAKLDVAGGRAAFEDVLKRFPQSNGARLGLARVASRAGDSAEAQRLWAEVVQREPTNGEALGALGIAALAGGPRAAEARAALEAAQKAAPSAPGPALTLANVFMRTGDAEKALQVLDSEGLRSGPLQRSATLHLMRAEALGMLQRWPDAEAAARTAFADDPDNPIARRALAVMQMRNGNPRAGEELLQLGLRNRPADPLLQGALVGIVQQARGLDAALAVADDLAKQRDAQPTAATLRGDLLLAAQRPGDAARAFAAAYAAAPSALLAQRTARAWQQAGDLGQATAALEAWLQRIPRDIGTLGLLAQLDLLSGRTEAAERRLSTVVEQAPTDAVAMNNLAWTLALRGGAENLARAKSLAERAYFLLPTAEAADTLGWVLVRSGEPARGLPLLREAVAAKRATAQSTPGAGAPAVEPGMVYRLAFALNATGDKAAALSTLEPVLAANAAFPERADAERLLATLRSGR